MSNNSFIQAVAARMGRLWPFGDGNEQIAQPPSMPLRPIRPPLQVILDHYAFTMRTADPAVLTYQAVPLDPAEPFYTSPGRHGTWVVGPAGRIPVVAPHHMVSWWWNLRDGYGGRDFYLDPQPLSG